MKAVGHPDDAESLAYAWRDADPALALLYIDTVEADLTRPKPVAVEAGRLKRFSDVVMSQQSGEGAQALGWYAYNVGQYEPAQAWFQKAMAWRPRDTTALGLALSLKQLGDKPALAAFLRDNGATFPALASLSSGETLKSGPAAPVRRRIVPTSPDASMPTRREQPDVGERPARRRVNAAARQTTCSAPAAGGGGRLTAMAALQAGWCLMALNRPQEAAIAFSAARDSAATRVDASYGEALAALRSNRTDQAVTAASSTDLASNRRNEVGLAALAQTAATTFDEGRYTDTLRALDRRRAFTAEPRDLTVLRAWSLFHTGRVEEARSLFSALDAQLSTSETRTGVAETVERSRY